MAQMTIDEEDPENITSLKSKYDSHQVNEYNPEKQKRGRSKKKRRANSQSKKRDNS